MPTPNPSPSSDKDEFADLPDIVDFSAIVLEDNSNPPRCSHPDPFEEFDVFNESDSFANIDLDAIPELGLAADRQSRVEPPPRLERTQIAHNSGGLPSAPNTQRSSAASTQYSFDELDAAAWQEADALVRNLNALAGRVAPIPTPPNPANVSNTGIISVATRPSAFFSDSPSASNSDSASQVSPHPSLKRKWSDTTEGTPVSSKKSKGKGKTKVDPREGTRKVLKGLTEESVTCAVCYHIFSEPLVCSPCGHSFCGECIVNWIKQTILKAPKCPLCRAPLTQGSLTIPNIALKQAIEKHVATLAENGVVEWQPQGQTYLEWSQRNVKYLALASDIRDLQNRRWESDDSASQNVPLAVALAISDVVSDYESSDEDSDEN